MGTIRETRVFVSVPKIHYGIITTATLYEHTQSSVWKKRNIYNHNNVYDYRFSISSIDFLDATVSQTFSKVPVVEFFSINTWRVQLATPSHGCRHTCLLQFHKLQLKLLLFAQNNNNNNKPYNPIRVYRSGIPRAQQLPSAVPYLCTEGGLSDENRFKGVISIGLSSTRLYNLPRYYFKCIIHVHIFYL